MAVKYVKDFVFGPMTSVQNYAKGGHVTKLPAKAAASAKGMPPKAKPNAPATGAKRMESPPTMGKGQGYAKGGKAMPSKAKASAKGMPAKAKPNAAPSGAKRMESPPSRGKRQGYAEGGRVPGFEKDVEPTNRTPGKMYDLAPSKPFKGEYQGYAKGGRMRRYAEGGDIQDPRAMSIEPGDGGAMDQYREYDPNAAFRVPDVSPMHYDTARTLERLPQLPDESPPTFPIATARKIEPPQPNDNAFFDSLLRLMQQEPVRPSRGYLNAEEGLSGIGRAMRERAMGQEPMRRPFMPEMKPLSPEEIAQYSIGKTFSPESRYAKGGKVSKGQAKVGKVMSEYKAGELHSGSKKGPLVKNPKQAVAIALSEARKAGAKIPKKADGGAMDAYGNKNEPYRGPANLTPEMRKEIAKAKQKEMERKMREAYANAPKSDPGLKKGGMARKGVPAHRGKAMYGGGKC